MWLACCRFTETSNANRNLKGKWPLCRPRRWKDFREMGFQDGKWMKVTQSCVL
jgi:hypothetical protein